MVNAAARRTRKAQSKPTTAVENENGVKVMSTLTIGDLVVEELGDYEFTRSGAGRKREPSQFDDAVNDWAGGPTRRIKADDEDHATEIVKQLQKACEYRNRGLEKRTETEDDQLYVVFRINEEKAKRAPRKPRGVNETPEYDAVENAETE